MLNIGDNSNADQLLWLVTWKQRQCWPQIMNLFPHYKETTFTRDNAEATTRQDSNKYHAANRSIVTDHIKQWVLSWIQSLPLNELEYIFPTNLDTALVQTVTRKQLITIIQPHPPSGASFNGTSERRAIVTTRTDYNASVSLVSKVSSQVLPECLEYLVVNDFR